MWMAGRRCIDWRRSSTPPARWYEFCPLRNLPSPLLRERASQIFDHEEWVRGLLRKKRLLRRSPLTHQHLLQHRDALSRKGRGQNSRERRCQRGSTRPRIRHLIQPVFTSPTLASSGSSVTRSTTASPSAAIACACQHGTVITSPTARVSSAPPSILTRALPLMTE